MEFLVHRRPPPLEPPLLERLEEPRLLESPALAPLPDLLNALLDGEERLAEELALGCEALGEGLGRLALGDAVGLLAEGVPVVGRAPQFQWKAALRHWRSKAWHLRNHNPAPLRYGPRPRPWAYRSWPSDSGPAATSAGRPTRRFG